MLAKVKLLWDYKPCKWFLPSGQENLKFIRLKFSVFQGSECFSMSVINILFKNGFVVAVLVGGLMILWEVPKWEQNFIAHEKIPTALEVNLPAFDIQTYLHHIKTRLPRYQQQFMQAAEKHGIPWSLLAAQAYQESHWNRNAMSQTGVRGLMMLTRGTASDLGIKDRLDPQKSIIGGAKYLARLYGQVPAGIQQPDRMFFALAAYNVGMGHITDAQILARRLNKNSDKWDDLKTVLPLLAKKEYYTTLPHRYARGWEPVQYVKRIRAYQKILELDLEKSSQQIAEL